MKIKFCPTLSDHDTQVTPEPPDIVLLDGERYEFPSKIVNFDVELPFLEAHREADELFVSLQVFYSPAQRNVWENPSYNGTETYRGALYEDF